MMGLYELTHNKEADLSNVFAFFTILGCKTLQALHFCVKIEVTEIEGRSLEISRAQ